MWEKARRLDQPILTLVDRFLNWAWINWEVSKLVILRMMCFLLLTAFYMRYVSDELKMGMAIFLGMAIIFMQTAEEYTDGTFSRMSQNIMLLWRREKMFPLRIFVVFLTIEGCTTALYSRELWSFLSQIFYLMYFYLFDGLHSTGTPKKKKEEKDLTNVEFQPTI